MKRHRATTSCPGIGPPRDDGPCDGVKRIGWQPDFYRIAILLWVERYHPELLLLGRAQKERREVARRLVATGTLPPLASGGSPIRPPRPRRRCA